MGGVAGSTAGKWNRKVEALEMGGGLTFTQQGTSIRNKCCVCAQQGQAEEEEEEENRGGRFKDKQKGHLHVWSAERIDKEAGKG